MKVRITHRPKEHELDGVRVDQYERGTVREVSSSIGSWLITEGYAEPEMRRRDEDREFWGITDLRSTATAHDRRSHH